MGLFDFFKKMGAVNQPKVSMSVSVPTRQDYEQQANYEAEEIAKKDRNCKRSEHGLTVSQILLLEYCKKGKYPNPEGGYQRFWWFEYGVRSVGESLKELEAKGFIKYASPSELLESLKVTDLKKILSELNFSVTGKKAELINRIKENVSDEKLKDYITAKKYTVTEMGRKEVADNEYVVYLHSHKDADISVWDVNMNADIKHWRDYIWGKYNQISIEYAQNGQWGLYRNVRHSMAEFLYDESRYIDAFSMYGEVCFYDVNGMDTYIDYDSPSDLLIEGILIRMKKIAEEGSLDSSKQIEILERTMSHLRMINERVPGSKMPKLIIDKMEML